MIKALELACKDIMRPKNEKMEMWQWGQGVVMFALEQAYKKTGNEAYIDFIDQWVTEHLEAEKPGYSINTTAPLNGVLALQAIRGDERYMGLCEEFAQYLMGENARCERGVFEHTCTGNYCPNQMWVDTVFMCGIFLTRYGLLTGNRMYVNEALRQLVLHFDFLHDPETDLLHHGYYSDDRKTHGALWGRGNGWFSAASAIILGMVDDSYPLKKAAEERYVRHLNALLKFQRPEGGWGTVINAEDSYIETSGTAGFCYGIAKGIEMGYLDASCAGARDKAYEYLKSKVHETGAMVGGSDGTCVAETDAEYKKIVQKYSEFTQGLSILAFSI